MNQSKRDLRRVVHIIEAIKDLELTTKNRKEDKITLYAIERIIQIIGEAANKISPEMRGKFPHINWSEMISMRNFIVHDYDKVNKNIVWDTIDNDIPILKKQIGEMFAEMQKMGELE